MGMESAITWDDLVITSYRCHPLAVLRGGTIKGVIGELLGRQCGMSNGKGGSMHIFTPRFFGGNGIVGAQVPVGAGLALAMQYQEKPAVTFTMYGDGAANQGQVFEAFNMVSPLPTCMSSFADVLFRPNSGTCPVSLFVKTTNTAWVLLQNGARQIRSTLLVVIRSLVSK